MLVAFVGVMWILVIGTVFGLILVLAAGTALGVMILPGMVDKMGGRYRE